VFKVDEGIGRPEILPDFFPCHHLARALKECRENLEGTLLKFDFFPVASHFTASKVNFEVSDPEATRGGGWYLHGGARPAFHCDLTFRMTRRQAKMPGTGFGGRNAGGRACLPAVYPEFMRRA
jgi:hypothetical protein